MYIRGVLVVCLVTWHHSPEGMMHRWIRKGCVGGVSGHMTPTHATFWTWSSSDFTKSYRCDTIRPANVGTCWVSRQGCEYRRSGNSFPIPQGIKFHSTCCALIIILWACIVQQLATSLFINFSVFLFFSDPDQYERAVREQERRARGIIQGMSAGLCKGLIR